jgi:glutamate-1-semialdehyde 2,1-aminomutase
MNLYWGERGPTPVARTEVDSASAELSRLLHLELLNRGIFAAVRGMFCISTAMSDHEIDETLEAIDAALHLLRPHIAKVAPHLLAG